MARHSEKKAKKIAQSDNTIYLLFIFTSTGIYLLIHFYKYFIKHDETIFTKKDIFGFIFLSGLNYAIYKLLNMFKRDSYLYGYFFDFLGLNCLIEILVNFSSKFWYLYLVYPAYFLIKGGKGLYGYISNIGKSDGTEEQEQDENSSKFKDSGHQTKQAKEKKQKVKYVKH